MEWKAVFNDEVISARLTPSEEYKKREGDVVVCVEESWNEISAEFVRQAQSVGIMSLDTESLLHPEAVRISASSQIDYTRTGMGVVWVVATAGEGLTARFDIRRLRKHAWPDSGQDKTFVDALPTTFRELLVDPSVVKVGSGILDDIQSDFVPINQEVSPVLELQWLVRQARGPVFNDDISVATGLDYVCRLLYGFGYKPVKVKKNVKPPPNVLTYKLYNWPLNLPTRSHNYLRNDSVLPVSLLYRIVRLLDVQAGSIREAMLKIFSDLVIMNSYGAACAGGSPNAPVSVTGWALLEQVEAFQLRQAPHISDDEEMDIEFKDEDRFPEDEEREESALVAAALPVPLLEEETDMIEAPEVLLPRESPPLSWFQARKRRLDAPDQFPDHQLCPDSVETSAEHSYGGGNSGGAKRAKNVLRNVRKSRLPGPERDEEGNREKTVASSPWFKLGSRCNYCGAAHHAREDCDKWDDFLHKGLVKGCDYPMCTYRKHHEVYRCDVLHGRCFECKLRGHVATQCEQSGGEYGEDLLRGIFEESANKGWKTRERFRSPAWGFYDVKPEDHYQEDYDGKRVEPVKYSALIGLEHEVAKLEVKRYNDKVAEALLDQE